MDRRALAVGAPSTQLYPVSASTRAPRSDPFAHDYDRRTDSAHQPAAQNAGRYEFEAEFGAHRYHGTNGATYPGSHRWRRRRSDRVGESSPQTSSQQA